MDEIPLEDAKLMLKEFCQKPYVKKTRYETRFAGKKWEIDEFSGGQVVQYNHLASPGHKRIHKVGANKTGTAGNQHFLKITVHHILRT